MSRRGLETGESWRPVWEGVFLSRRTCEHVPPPAVPRSRKQKGRWRQAGVRDGGRPSAGTPPKPHEGSTPNYFVVLSAWLFFFNLSCTFSWPLSPLPPPPSSHHAVAHITSPLPVCSPPPRAASLRPPESRAPFPCQCSVWVRFHIGVRSYAFASLLLACFTQHNALQVHPRCRRTFLSHKTHNAVLPKKKEEKEHVWKRVG